MERFASRQRNPWIGLAPDDLYRTANISEHRFDFCGVLFVGLRELPVEALSPFFGKPRLDKLFEVLGIDLVRDRALDVGLREWICGGKPRPR
jgi:hypothetical protein